MGSDNDRHEDPRTEARPRSIEQVEHDTREDGENRGSSKGMRRAAVPERRTVRDTEYEADDVSVWEHRRG